MLGETTPVPFHVSSGAPSSAIDHITLGTELLDESLLVLRAGLRDCNRAPRRSIAGARSPLRPLVATGSNARVIARLDHREAGIGVALDGVALIALDIRAVARRAGQTRARAGDTSGLLRHPPRAGPVHRLRDLRVQGAESHGRPRRPHGSYRLEAHRHQPRAFYSRWSSGTAAAIPPAKLTRSSSALRALSTSANDGWNALYVEDSCGLDSPQTGCRAQFPSAAMGCVRGRRSRSMGRSSRRAG